MPLYPAGITVRREQPMIDDDCTSYTIYDNITNLSRNVSISGQAADNYRMALVGEAIRDGIRQLIERRATSRPPPLPVLSREFDYQYNCESITYDDVASMRPTAWVGRADQEPEPEPALGKIRRNLPS